jgi:hypothetical protein
MVLLLGLGFADLASAASFADLGKQVGVHSDGAASLAYERDRGEPVHVLSEGPAGTTERDVAAPAGCEFSAVGAGQVVFDCYSGASGPRGPRFVDIASGTSSTPPGVDALMRYERVNEANAEIFFSSALGARLLRIHVEGEHIASDLYLDRVTGKVIPNVLASTHTAPSLDVPAGRVRLCTPLRRPRDLFLEFIDEIREPVPATYRRPYLVYLWRGAVILRHCGSTVKSVLGRSSQYEPLLTDRFVAWQTQRALHVYSLRTHATTIYRLPEIGTICAEADDRHVGCGRWLAQVPD